MKVVFFITIGYLCIFDAYNCILLDVFKLEYLIKDIMIIFQFLFCYSFCRFFSCLPLDRNIDFRT